ncbi:MAG TPA: hypothetical protein ENL07_06835 [Chlorobaculum parvum]|uniref:Uncharacterized protein n=1 Tax=Chlorobaculum parvum TaxID=274539 RepID=A0A7C5DKV4_9CHLB|nr:hypothetical protein [Chlorobaculum parvum]
MTLSRPNASSAKESFQFIRHRIIVEQFPVIELTLVSPPIKLAKFYDDLFGECAHLDCLIAALTCGAGGEPQVRRLSRQVKWLVPAQGDGTRPNEVSAAIPGDVVGWNNVL